MARQRGPSTDKPPKSRGIVETQPLAQKPMSLESVTVGDIFALIARATWKLALGFLFLGTTLFSIGLAGAWSPAARQALDGIATHALSVGMLLIGALVGDRIDKRSTLGKVRAAEGGYRIAVEERLPTTEIISGDDSPEPEDPADPASVRRQRLKRD